MQAWFHSWWERIRKPLIVIVITTLFVGLIALIISIILGYVFHWEWTGLFGGYPKKTQKDIIFNGTIVGKTTDSEQPPAKTLWDWLQLLGVLAIPVVVGIGTAWFTKRQAKESAAENEDNQREETLQGYMDKMSELLIKEHLQESIPTIDNKFIFKENKLRSKDNARTVARSRTLTVLSRLDSKRKKSVLQFLYESRLLKRNNCIVSLDGADLSSADLSSTNLGSADLSGVILKEANLKGANLNEANLSRTDLRRANLYGADLRGAILKETDLSRTDLNNAYLDGADLRDAILKEADLSEANFLHARPNLCRADLKKSNLRKVLFYNINLSGAELNGADLRGATLVEADLCGARLGRFSEIRIHGARYFGYPAHGGDFHPANLRGANLSKASLREAHLNGVYLRQTNLDEADLSKADLTKAKLHKANLINVKLCGAKLIKAELYKADLRGAKMDDKTDLSGAKLQGAKYNKEAIQMMNDHKNLVTIESTKWPQDDFDPKAHGAICVDCEKP